MTKVRDLTEVFTAEGNDLFYMVDVSEGANAGRKISVASLRGSLATSADQIDYDNTDSTLTASNVKTALDELDSDLNNHSGRHNPDGTDALNTASAVTLTPNLPNAAGTANSYARSDHVHNVPVATPVSIGVANAVGSAASFARSDHVHNHGVQTDPSLHAVASTSANGFMSSADKTKLDTLNTGFLQYTNSALQTTTSTTFVNIVLDLNVGSFANGLFTKVNTTDFRADFNGYVKITFHASPFTASNDRGTEFVIKKNAADQNYSKVRNVSKNIFERTNTVASSVIVACANGDIFNLAYRSLEADQVNLTAQYVNMRIEVYRIS